ncbi:hypothetical protein IQ225_18435 [Synechocystis salina LEGE 06155]|nr:hypothetical protein [Synechocystis sp. LEGE 06083]MBE9176803.1 hypothetical protein [Synechocystis salina LEGE 06155]MBE9193811.1 hypothetical protein [Synechocystis sp. LEGE 06083]
MKEETFSRELAKILKIHWTKELHLEFIKISEAIINDSMEQQKRPNRS